MPTSSLFLYRTIAFGVLALCLGVLPVSAATKQFTWDPPRLDDGTLIPSAANVQYRLHYGQQPRGTAQRDTFTYPNTTPLTSAATVSLTLAGGQRLCASVVAVLAQPYQWTVGVNQYALAAGDSNFSNEVCIDIPVDPVTVPAPANFRVVP